MDSKNWYRVALCALLLLSAAVVTSGYLSMQEPDDPYSAFEQQAALPADEREQLAPPRDGVTVVTSHVRNAGDIVAINPNGTLLYHNDTHDGYWDVDPAPSGRYTVTYAATDEVAEGADCSPVGGDFCIRQSIEQVNLSTGEVTVLYSRIDPRYHSSEWHDVDRLNGTHYVVADMYNDEVFVVDTETGIVTWEWNLQNYLPLSTGGPYPEDWAHLNDVEVLDDGRLMVSLRNQDQVVFLDVQRGVDHEWTLGADGNHERLYEQHNPDYIPAENGGPAVLVADSENNRLVEYQRTDDGSWRRTWEWQDRRLQWPRDADRLPNGHTLVTDSNGGRVFELDRQGNVVWSLPVPIAYEAERLDTGDESTGGPSASRADLSSQTIETISESDDSLGLRIKTAVKSLFPSKVVNGIIYLTPGWMRFYDLLATLLGTASLLTWVGLELSWTGYRLRNPLVHREDR